MLETSPLSKKQRKLKEKRETLFSIPLPSPLKNGQSFYHWLDEITEVVVFREGKRYRVFQSICPHMGAQLEYDRKNRQLRCPWHELDFCTVNRTSNHPRYRKCVEYEVEERGNSLRVRLP